MLHPYALRLASTSPQSEFHLCLRCSIWPPPGPPLYLLRSVNRFSSPKGHPSEISTLLMLPCYEQMPGRCPCQKFPAAVCVHALPAGLRSGISKGLNSQHPYLCWDTHACTGPMVHGISHHSDACTHTSTLSGGSLEVVISSASSRSGAFLRASLQYTANESCSTGACKLQNIYGLDEQQAANRRLACLSGDP